LRHLPFPTNTKYIQRHQHHKNKPTNTTHTQQRTHNIHRHNQPLRAPNKSPRHIIHAPEIDAHTQQHTNTPTHQHTNTLPYRATSSCSHFGIRRLRRWSLRSGPTGPWSVGIRYESATLGVTAIGRSIGRDTINCTPAREIGQVRTGRHIRKLCTYPTRRG
jgi:hypothetical protein